MKNIKKIKLTGLLILVITVFIFSSCTKSSDEYLSKEQKELQDNKPEVTEIDEKNISESEEDLTTVDYKEFYEQLAPHGEWIEVTFEDIGLNSNEASTESSGNKDYSVSDLMGIKSAYATSVAKAELLYVWKPSVELAVKTEAIASPVFVPYTNGQWVNSDAGWYFKAPTPVEETVSHYGRWVNSPTAGWLWVPGRVWAPAWVDWKQNDEYVSWAPLPPMAYIVNGIMNTPVIDDNNYVIVEKKYFVEPEVYKYSNIYADNTGKVYVSQLSGTEGIVFSNNVIINKGPDINIIQAIFGRNIEFVKIQRVKTYNEVKYSENEFKVYSPGFYRYKNKGKSKVYLVEPKSYKKYDEWKVIKSKEKEYRKEEKEMKKEEKEYKKENNGNGQVKKSDDNKSGKKNDNNDKGNSNDKKDNGKKNDDKNNGNKQGKENGNKQEGKNNGKGKK
jgi:hypothetical protein